MAWSGPLCGEGIVSWWKGLFDAFVEGLCDPCLPLNGLTLCIPSPQHGVLPYRPVVVRRMEKYGGRCKGGAPPEVQVLCCRLSALFVPTLKTETYRTRFGVALPVQRTTKNT